MSEQIHNQKTRSIAKEIEIKAPVEAVWKALTDAEELINWFPLDAKVTPGKGGAIRMSWRNEYEFQSPIEIWETNKHLRMVWADSGSEDPHGDDEQKVKFPAKVAVDYYLESQGSTTVLRLVHSGFSSDSDWDELYDGTCRGWDYQLWGLRHYLENHRGVPRDVVYVRKILSDVSREQAWEKFISADGFFKQGNLDQLKSGEHYSLQTAPGETLNGVVKVLTPPKDFIATVDNLNHATLRIQLDDIRNRRDITIILSTYGLPKAEVDYLRANWGEILERLYG